MNIKSVMLASAVAIAAVSGAHAADAIVYEEPAPVAAIPAFSWTGGYVGGQIGYGWGKSRFDVLLNGYELKPRGFLGGVYAGYNFDLGNSVVLGVDADVTYNDVNKKIDTGLETLKTELRWSGAVRARAGYAVDRFLPYIAGGVAFGQVKNNYSVSALNRSFSDKNTLTGWTIGAGVDYAATDNLIVRLEYRYTDYGRKDFDFGGASSIRNKFKTNDVRLGIAYKF